MRTVAGFIFLGALLGCSSSTPSASEPNDASVSDASISDASVSDAGAFDAGPLDAGPADAVVDVDKSAPCATTFGSALTNAFGRLDGVVVAVVPPNDQACALPNSTHLVVQVSIAGVVYRMVVDVLSNQLSDSGSPDVFFRELDAPLASGAWAEGWHPGFALDYVTTLAVQSTSFTAMSQADLVAKITSELDLGAHVSVFATSDGEPNSAHLVHRNLAKQDGAIVVHPESASAHYLLMRFAEQAF